MGNEKCTEELIERALKLKKGGANNADISAAVGVNPSTLSQWINHPKSKNQTALSKALKKAEADYKNALLAIIARDAKERDWKAAAWLLERKYPAEYAKRSAFVDSDGKDAAPVVVLGIEPKALGK